MQFIETTLAFAVTMLVLSMVVSTFVELIHRAFGMREAGLKYMLGQVFDQVLQPYLTQFKGQLPQALAAADEAGTLKASFVKRMSANRAPMGVTPAATLANPSPTAPFKDVVRVRNGRALASMTSAQFMERLGSIDVGAAVRNANDAANKAHVTADADVVLKDVAQKFEAFGDEAAGYFEGRARLLSVLVAIVFAFVVYVDAFELFQTFLRDPTVRAKVIEQTQAAMGQQKAAQDKVDAAKAAPAALAADAKPDADSTADIEKLKSDLQGAINDTKNTITQLTDLGVPIGWTDARAIAARSSVWLWTCKQLPDGVAENWGTFRQTCRSDDAKKAGYLGIAGRQYMNVWLQMPRDGKVCFYLLIGGLLIGLGAPFWYDVVASLTNVRGVARGITAPETRTSVNAFAAAAQTPAAQPATPAGVFKAAEAAQAENIPRSQTTQALVK